MAARYWRITGIETYGGGDLELSELQLFTLDANNNPVRVDQTATLTSSVPPIAGTLSALNDGDTSTTARFHTGPGLAFVWDFGVGGANVDGAYLAGAPGNGTGVKSLLLQYSSDGMRYETLGYVSNLNVTSPSGYVDVRTFGSVLFLPFDGPHGSRVFINYGRENFSLIPVGNPYISNTKFKFGSGSAYFSGDGTAIRCDDLAKYITNVPFTLDCWVYITTPLKIPTGNNAIYNLPIIGQTVAGPYGEVYLGFDSSFRFVFDLRGGTPGYSYGGIGPSVQTDTWVHVLFSLSGSYLR
ncbi:LamG domain-containing protein, partial [Acinetobacter baumannii]|nr:LamG domain-containing protein [Acinetobacter baumannii]